MKPERKLAADTDIVAFLGSLDPERRRAGIELLGPQELASLDRAWEGWAHDGQLAPLTTESGGAWSTWVIKAGRGFGKTLAGAQWVTSLIAQGQPLSIALVGATMEDARRVMVEGRSGLIEVAGEWLDEWHASLGRLRFRTGASAQIFSGATPHLLRGPEHHYAWCDELAKWEKGQECWDMLQLGLRLGDRPRALVTTTPRSGPVLAGIMAEAGTVVTGGPTRANPHLARAWQERVHRLYAGTRLGRQELDGEMLPDAAGALWTVELLERCRSFETGLRDAGCASSSAPPQDERGGDNDPNENPARPEERAGPSLSKAGSRLEGPSRLDRTLIAVDPPIIDGTCGIVACAREGEGAEAIAHILADHSVTGRSPEGWAGAVAAAAEAHATHEVVAEANQGGKMVKAVLLTADPRLRVKLVTAHTGKTARAEPVAHLFESGRAVLHGRMPELEAQLLGMIAGGGYEGPGHSPDRADAMVWGVNELMLGRRGEVRVWTV